MATINFNANEVEPSVGFEAIPAGKYQAVIVDSDMKPNKAGTGEYLQLEFEVIEGEFKQGLLLVREIEAFIRKYSHEMNVHHKMLIYYKIACLYFGDGNYTKCMEYLGRITSTKDPQIRRDLQVFSRILNLIASYEAGIDYNLDYQIRSVYSFLVKSNDMGEVQKEMLSFLKKLNTIYAEDVKTELKVLYNRLKPYENRTFERRAFYYLDILSWLESKITGKSVGEIVRRKFKELSA